MVCEKCKMEHDGNYASGRFCSSKCARSFATSHQRKDINRRVSEKMSGRRPFDHKEVQSIYSLHSITIHKILIERTKLGCFRCGWKEASCDVHHIHGRKIPNPHDHKNLTYLCPNCHRMVHTGLVKIETLKNMHDMLGEDWKRFYYLKPGPRSPV